MLLENCTTDAGNILQTAFEEVNPGPGLENVYLYHPTIKKSLKEISLDPLTADKQIRIDFRVLQLKRTRVTTCLNKYMVWARNDAILASLGFRSS